MLLEIEQLTKKYQRYSHCFFAVDHVNLSISHQDFVTIVGRSGSGKSTLLNMIAGLLKPTSGTVRVNGKDIFSMNDKEISSYRNSVIGYVPQGHSILGNLSVLDNVRLPHFLFQRGGDGILQAQSLLEQVGIEHLAQTYPKQLSGGELRRVSIARALMNRPVLLIADEPTSDLDAQTTAEIMALFSEISKQGTAVLLVTHELDTLCYGNSVYVMDAGRLTPADITTVNRYFRVV